MIVKDFLYEQGFSARIIVKLKQNRGDITCNGKPIRMVDLVYTGDILTVLLKEKTDVIPNFSIEVPIVYEDEDIIVYNKPPFMPIHPSVGHHDDTLANVFCAHMQSLFAETAFHPINRLDRDTSGLCVVGKNAFVTTALAKCIKKEYTAVACGVMPLMQGRIDSPIIRIAPQRLERGISKDGQSAITNYEVIRQSSSYTLVRISLETGRTHQIRVHFSSIGHPLAGDSMYGGSLREINRQALCCNKVSFIHPISKESVNLSIDIHNDMQNLV